MNLKNFIGKPCNAKSGFEFFSKEKIELDLNNLSENLSAICNIEINSQVLLIVNMNGQTISIFKNGKIVIRGENNEDIARKKAEKICDFFDECLIKKKHLFN